MKKPALALAAVVLLSLSACIVNAPPPKDVGSANSDGSIYLGWRLLSKTKKQASDRETFPVGPNLGNYSGLRLTTDRPLTLAQVTVVFADGQQWVAPAPAALAAGQWSDVIALPGGPRAIHSVVVDGRSTSDMHAKLELHGTR